MYYMLKLLKHIANLGGKSQNISITVSPMTRAVACAPTPQNFPN